MIDVAIRRVTSCYDRCLLLTKIEFVLLTLNAFQSEIDDFS